MPSSPGKTSSSRRFSESDSFQIGQSPITPNKRKTNIFNNMRRITKKELLTMSESRLPRAVKFSKEVSDKFFRYTSKNELEGFYSRHLRDVNHKTTNSSKNLNTQKHNQNKLTPKPETSQNYKNPYKANKNHTDLAIQGTINTKTPAHESAHSNHSSAIKQTPDRVINTNNQTKSILNTSFTNMSSHNSSFISTTSSSGRVRFREGHRTPNSQKRRKLTSPPLVDVPMDISDLGLGFVEKVLTKSQEAIQPPNLGPAGSDTRVEKGDPKPMAHHDRIHQSPREPFDPDVSMFSPVRDQSQLNLIDRTPDIFTNECDLSMDLINISAIKSPSLLDFDLFSIHGSTHSRKRSVTNGPSSVTTTPAKPSSAQEPYPRHSTPPIRDNSKNPYTSPLLKYSTIKLSNGKSTLATPTKIQALVDASKSFEDFESYNNFNLPIDESFKEVEQHKGDAHIQEELELFDMISVQSSEHSYNDLATDQPTDPKSLDTASIMHELKKVQEKLASATQQINQLESSNQNLRSSLADKDKHILQLESKVQQLKSESEANKKNFQRTRSNEAAEKYLRESQLEIAQENRNRIRAQLQDSQNKVAELVQENRNQDEYIKKSQQVVEELQGIVKKLQNDLGVSEKRFNLLKEHAEKKLKEASNYIQKRHETYVKNIDHYKELREKDKEYIETLQAKLDESTKENSELMEVSERILSYMEESDTKSKN